MPAKKDTAAVKDAAETTAKKTVKKTSTGAKPKAASEIKKTAAKKADENKTVKKASAAKPKAAAETAKKKAAETAKKTAEAAPSEAKEERKNLVKAEKEPAAVVTEAKKEEVAETAKEVKAAAKAEAPKAEKAAPAKEEKPAKAPAKKAAAKKAPAKEAKPAETVKEAEEEKLAPAISQTGLPAVTKQPEEAKKAEKKPAAKKAAAKKPAAKKAAAEEKAPAKEVKPAEEKKAAPVKEEKAAPAKAEKPSEEKKPAAKAETPKAEKAAPVKEAKPAEEKKAAPVKEAKPAEEKPVEVKEEVKVEVKPEPKKARMPELTDEKLNAYRQFDVNTLLDMARAMGLEKDMETLKRELAGALVPEAYTADVLAALADAEQSFDFDEDGYDLTVVPVLFDTVLASLPYKASEATDTEREIHSLLEENLGQDGAANAKLYDRLFDMMRKILENAQHRNVRTLGQVAEEIPGDLRKLTEHFMDVAYDLLPFWTYNDVKYYEGFIYAFISQFDDLKDLENRAMMDVADLFIKHGDYGRGDADYNYVLRENQLKDQIYYRFANVYRNFDLQKAKAIAGSALQYVDGRYDYYPRIMEILNS